MSNPLTRHSLERPMANVPGRKLFPRGFIGRMALAGTCAMFLASAATAADLPVQDGLIVWLKADAINTSDPNEVRVAGADTFVKEWKDQSGLNRPAANSTDNDQPLYVPAVLNGLPVLRFAQDDDDNGDRLYLGDLSQYAANAGSVFIVANIDNDGRYNLFGNRANDERWVADTWSESHPGSFRNNRASGTFNQFSWPTFGSHIFALESDRSIYRFLVDGAEIGNDTPEYHDGKGQNWTIANRATNGQQLRGDIAEVIIYNHILTADEANAVGWYLTEKYGVFSSYTSGGTLTPQAKIYDFGLPGNPAIINGTDITLTVPFLTDASALAPTFMLSTGATCNKASGSTQNFTTPQTYTVVSSDLATTNVYTVTVIVRAASIAYDFNSGLQGWTQIWPAAGNGNVWENGGLGSGGDGADTRFARSPEFILHGQEALSFQLRGGESPLTAPGVGPSAIPEIALTGAGFAGVALRDVATDTYILSRRRSGNDGNAWQDNNFTTAELAPHVGKKCTLDYIDYNKGGWGWTYLDNVAIPAYGTRVTIETPDIGIVVGSNATVVVTIPQGFNATTPVTVFITNANPAALTINGSAATVTTVNFPQGVVYSQTLPVAGVAAGDVKLTVACAGLDGGSLTLTVCPPLIGRWIAGAANLSDASGFRPAGRHDGVAIGANAAALAFSSDLPPGSTGQSLDLRAGNVAVMITNSATTDGAYLNTYDDVIRNKFTIAFWAKGFPSDWNGWVSKRGEDGIGWQIRRMSGDPVAGFTLRGVDNDDGWGSTINVNDNAWHHYVGVWNQATGTRTLYVDGVLSHVVNNTVGQMMNLAAAKHLALGARQGSGAAFEGYFAGLLYDVRLYSYPLTATEVRALIPPAIKLAGRSAVAVLGSTPLTVTIPAGANASSPVTVYLTNSNPSLLNIGGNAATTVPVVFAAGGPASQDLTLNGLSAGLVTLSAGASGMASTSKSLQVYAPSTTGNLIGHWIAGAPHLADVSGYTDGVHDGTFVGVPPANNFTNDTPLGRPGQSVDLRGAGNIAVRINNTRMPDANYLNTFDDNLQWNFTVAFWAKGFPQTWAGWVTKEGEDGRGWQLRRWAGNPYACFTIRGLSNEDGTGSSINVNDNNWHHYVGVWDYYTGQRSLFIDGVLSHIITNEFEIMNLAPNAPLVFGAKANQDNNYAGDRWVKCQLFDVRMYNSSLGAGDVLNLVGAVLASPSSLSLSAPSPNTNFITVTVPPSAVASSAVTVVVTSDNPSVAIPENAVGGVLNLTFPAGGANSITFPVQANGPGTAHFTYSCASLPALGTTTVAVQQPNIGGLVAYWNFDNQTLEETAGFQPAGTHDGLAVGTVAYVPGRLGGYAADLRAANTAVRIQNTTLTDADYRTTFDAFLFNSAAGFSFSCWVKGMPTSDWSSWIAKDGEAAGYAVRRAWASDRLTFTLRNSGAPAGANPSDDDPTSDTAVIRDNLWHHLAAVYDPAALQRRLYLDGVEVISITDSNLTTPPAASPLFFGARDTTGDPRFAQVIVDEIRAYDKALTPAEILAEVGDPIITIVPNKWAPNLGDPDLLATVTVPASMVATSTVNVTLTSANPAVAQPVGAVAGSLTLTFNMGGANTASVPIHAAGLGTTTISGSSPSSVVDGQIAITVTPTPVLIGHWLTGAPDLLEVSGYRPAGTHDGIAVGDNAAFLGWSFDVPPNQVGQSLDLTIGTVGVRVANSANGDVGYQPTFDTLIAPKFSVAFWAKGMPGEWAGWVTKLGENGKGWQLRRMGNDNIAGFTIRGVDNEDGWGSGINVNDGNWHHYVGIWDQAAGARHLYVDGVFSHTVNNNSSQVLSQAPGAHLIFGGLEDEAGSLWGNRWVSCLLYDVRIFDSGISEGRIQTLVGGSIPVPPVMTVQPWPGNQIRIAWPAADTGYSIDQASSVMGPWAPSGLLIGVEGAENAAYAPLGSGAQFFRLVK